MPHFTPEQNVLNWLRDSKLAEIVPAVRKCVQDVRVEICVRVPDGWDGRPWTTVLERVAQEEVAEGAQHSNKEGYFRLDSTRQSTKYALMGVWVKLETEGT